MMRKTLTYSISDLRPYINWIYFDYAWGISAKAKEEQTKLRKEANEMLDKLEPLYKTHAVFGLYEANSDGDDLLLGDVRIPLLRQQKKQPAGKPNLCLSDFVRPIDQGIKDEAGAFATTVDMGLETDFDHDPYEKMLVQTLADRLAEATAEKMHEDVRKNYWGYAPDEELTPDDLFKEKYRGIRPAVGYPSLPDFSINFILSDLLGMKDIGIHLTESGAMKPHASVSGLMFAHPASQYFTLGKIGEDQLEDYTRRRGLPEEVIRRFLGASLK